jgi:hypothetical protein
MCITTQGLCIHLRWTKTLQRHRQSARIHILSIPGSLLCPLAAFQSLQRSYPVHPTDPILSYRVSGQLFIISQSQIRRALKRLVLSLNLHPNISFSLFSLTVHGRRTPSGHILVRVLGTWQFLIFSPQFSLLSSFCLGLGFSHTYHSFHSCHFNILIMC